MAYIGSRCLKKGTWQESDNRNTSIWYSTHAKEANEPRPSKDLRIYIKINGKRKTGGVDKDIRGLFACLRKGKVGHGLKADVLIPTGGLAIRPGRRAICSALLLTVQLSTP